MSCCPPPPPQQTTTAASSCYKLDKLKPFLALPEPYRCATCPYCNGSRDPTPRFSKPSPWEFWEKIGRPRFVVAPMVDQSELPFRMVCRRYGADLAYTPMFHSRIFAESEHYRNWQFTTCPEDRPTFVQFCGDDADVVLAAAKLVEDRCDAVDLNLGCPQGIAKRGHYGAFLMESWDIIHTVLHTLSVELRIPVTAKMRIFEDEGLTLRYARMLRDAGAHVIAVHGRLRDQKGGQTGVADLQRIAAVKRHITEVPIIANGNIQLFSDAEANLTITGCDAVMSAEGLLWDCRLFGNPQHPVLTGRSFQMDQPARLAGVAAALEYMECLRQYPVDLGFAKAHLFKLVHHSLEVAPEMRLRLGDLDAKDGLDAFVAFLKDLHEADVASGVVGAYVKKTKVREGATRGDDGEEGEGSSEAVAASAKAAEDEPMDLGLFTASW